VRREEESLEEDFVTGNQSNNKTKNWNTITDEGYKLYHSDHPPDTSTWRTSSSAEKGVEEKQGREVEHNKHSVSSYRLFSLSFA
jgi:hypothetical protein